MDNAEISWTTWVRFFSRRADRRLPDLDDPMCYKNIPQSVARSLAVFQLGESGGGTVIEQARQSRLGGVNEQYAKAIELFVAEEHRHAEILAICVRNLGGQLLQQNWTARLFVFARRLIGLRLKILVLLAAEVVGICFYHLIATRLPHSRLKSLLAQLVNDERAHLHFHCTFLRAQTTGQVQRFLFAMTWRLTMIAAALVVTVDHRDTIRDLQLGRATVWRRWMTYGKLAERMILGAEVPGHVDLDTVPGDNFPGCDLPRAVVAICPDPAAGVT